MTLAFREAGPADGPAALFLHGYPNSSYLWKDQVEAAGAAGWHAVAPDLPGYGDSDLGKRAGTWEDHVEALDVFVDEHELAPVALVLHDWGGLIGLRWACEHRDALRGLVVSCTGFFPDGKWHGLARAMRTPGELEQTFDAMDREGFGQMLAGAAPNATPEALDEYFKAFSTPERRRAQLALYRSGDFEKIEAYDGCLAQLDVPALALWGAQDPFAPVAGAHRFARELPRCEVVVLEEAGHFLQEDAPQRVTEEVVRFLRTLG